MAEQKSVEQTQEVVDLVLSLVKAVSAAKADGKIDLADIGQVVALAPKIISAADKLGEVPEELKDLSTDEAQQLVAHIMASLVIEEPKARAVVEKSLLAVDAAWELVKAIRA